MRRTNLWLLTTLALLLSPLPAAALEVLVLTTPTPLSYPGEQTWEIQNLGPSSIWVQRGSSTGLAVGKGRELARRETLRVTGVSQTYYAIAAAPQASGAGTILTPGVANSAQGDGVDPSCATTLATLDPVIGVTVTTIARVAGSRSIDFQSKSTTIDCYATLGPEALTTTGSTGWFIPKSDFRPWSLGYGSDIGPLKLACTAAGGATFHVDQCK